MNKDYPCPLCKSKKWKPVQEYVFRSGNHSSGKFPINERLTGLSRVIGVFLRSLMYAAPRPFRIERKLLTTYESLRREVLFDLWFLGEEKIITTSQYCLNCGFMAYNPRHSERDITAKYRFLGERSRPEEIESWTTYNTDNSGLLSNDIRLIAVDHEGVIWFGIWGGGVIRFDGTTWANDSSRSCCQQENLFIPVSEISLTHFLNRL